METVHPFLCGPQLLGCVRTIVVWKHESVYRSIPWSFCCVRTIVVWKLCDWEPLPIDCTACCVRTIVVWKRISCAKGTKSISKLRKNHSGMETHHHRRSSSRHPTCCVRTIVVWKPLADASYCCLISCCVRTIVVWKPRDFVMRDTEMGGLRKNHSGMETFGLFSCIERAYDRLRKNHSGMETWKRVTATIWPFSRCVRTIVVWKRLLCPRASKPVKWLRKNDSGMETLTSPPLLI